MNPPSARQIDEARRMRDDLYKNKVNDPDKWEQVARLFNALGFILSARELKRKAELLRKRPRTEK